MRTRSKLALAGLAAAILLSMAVTTASARTLRTDEQGFRVTWRSLEFVEAGFFRISFRCPVTLEGSFHSRTIEKIIGSLIGYLTRAIVKGNEGTGACTGGTATFLSETLPWHVTYEGFSGILPNITAIRLLLVRLRLRIDLPFVEACLFEMENVDVTTTGTTISGTFKPERLEPDPGQVFPCGTELEGEFRGSGTVTRLGATTRILITLI